MTDMAKFNQSVKIDLNDYIAMNEEVERIKQQYPSVLITKPMLIEATIGHWRETGRPALVKRLALFDASRPLMAKGQ